MLLTKYRVKCAQFVYILLADPISVEYTLFEISSFFGFIEARSTVEVKFVRIAMRFN